jgi:hypothetical protein
MVKIDLKIPPVQLLPGAGILYLVLYHLCLQCSLTKQDGSSTAGAVKNTSRTYTSCVCMWQWPILRKVHGGNKRMCYSNSIVLTFNYAFHLWKILQTKKASFFDLSHTDQNFQLTGTDSLLKAQRKVALSIISINQFRIKLSKTRSQHGKSYLNYPK